MDQVKKSFTLYLDQNLKDEIEDYFLKCKIKNFQIGYRKLIILGFENFKKVAKNGGKNGV